MDVNIDINVELNDKLVDDIVGKSTNDFLNNACDEALAEALQNVPIKSGNLYNNTKYINEEGHVEFLSDTPYAEKVYDNYRWFDCIDEQKIQEEIEQHIKGEL